MMPLFSVVVPTCRRPDLLERCLHALAGQSLPPDQYEIIIADDAASPATEEQVKRTAASNRVTIHYLAVQGIHGPAAARNRGWQSAIGQIIAFTDDDCVPDPDWLSAAALTFERLPIDAAWGRLSMPLPADPTDYEKDAAGLSRAEFVTANCFCRLSALQKIGGFDESFALAWREDSDLYFSLIEHGFRISHIPEALVVHPIRPAFWGVSLWQQRKTMFDALLYKKHPQLYRQHIHAFPCSYYVACLAMFCSLIGIVLHSPLITGLCLAIWLGITLRFYLHRIRDTSRKPSHLAEMLVTSALIPLLSTWWHLRGLWRFRVFFR